MPRSVFAGAMLFLSISCAWAADDAAQTNSTPPAQPNMQEPAVGDHWTYQISDEISGKVTATRTDLVTELSKDGVTTRFDIAGTGRSGVIVYDRSWNIVSDRSFHYSPNDGSGVRLPLAVGAQWKFTTDSQNSSNGATFKRIGSGHVTANEKVTTKAGTFDTFVIETQYKSRNNKDPSRVSEVSLKTWFSPELDHWVKRSWMVREGGHLVRSDAIELTDFGRKK
jgi:hypothetical protein